jgi:hypothetical protein
MWRKKDDAVGAQPEFGSMAMPGFNSESTTEAGPNEAYRNRYAEMGSGGDPQKFFAEGQPALPASMGTYTEAVNEFTKNATAFIEQVPLLTKALDAYEQALKLSAELRKVLDMGDESLRTLMTPLEQVINLRAVRSGPDRKKPEAAKVEAIRGVEESAEGQKVS